MIEPTRVRRARLEGHLSAVWGEPLMLPIFHTPEEEHAFVEGWATEYVRQIGTRGMYFAAGESQYLVLRAARNLAAKRFGAIASAPA